MDTKPLRDRCKMDGAAIAPCDRLWGALTALSVISYGETDEQSQHRARVRTADDADRERPFIYCPFCGASVVPPFTP